MDFWNSPEYRLLRLEIEPYSSSVESVEFLDELQTRETKKNLEIRASQGDPLRILCAIVFSATGTAGVPAEARVGVAEQFSTLAFLPLFEGSLELLKLSLFEFPLLYRDPWCFGGSGD